MYLRNLLPVVALPMQIMHATHITPTPTPPTIAYYKDEPRCYYDKGKLAPPDILPCYPPGASGNDIVPCCKKGNPCQEQGSCYDEKSGVNYQYGCNDPNYEHENCPWKCNLDRSKVNWVGLVYCDKAWICNHADTCGRHCPNHPLDPLIELPPMIYCEEMDKKWKAFDAGKPLKTYMTLPTLNMKINEYFLLHPMTKTSQSSKRSTTPTTSGTTTSKPSSAPSSAPSSVSSSASSTVSFISSSSVDQTESSSSMLIATEIIDLPPDETGPRKSKSSSNMMAIGIGAGVPIAIAFVGALLFFFWRKHGQSDDNALSEEPTEMEEVQNPQVHDGFEVGRYSKGADLPAEGGSLYEMPSPLAPTELEGSSTYGAYGLSADDGQGSSNYGGRSTLHSRVNSPMGSIYSETMHIQAGVSPMSGISEEGVRSRIGRGESYDERAEEAAETSSSALQRKGYGRTVYELET